MKTFLNKNKKIILLIILLSLNIFSTKTIIVEEKEHTIKDVLLEIETRLYKNRKEIINETHFYINNKREIQELCIEHLFDICEKYDIDIRLSISQGWLESHFGTAGMAKRTNSIFNVGAFDNLKFDEIELIYKYETINCSIEPYAILISKRYLFGQKTEFDLLQNFVDVDGKRYASTKEYETKIKKMWDEINNTTTLDSLLNEREKLKYCYGLLLDILI